MATSKGLLRVIDGMRSDGNCEWVMDDYGWVVVIMDGLAEFVFLFYVKAAVATFDVQVERSGD
jgi:hypothetical protein